MRIFAARGRPGTSGASSGPRKFRGFLAACAEHHQMAGGVKRLTGRLHPDPKPAKGRFTLQGPCHTDAQ